LGGMNMEQKERYQESRKLLRKYSDEKLRITMLEYEIDPEGYTRSGMVDALADAMSKFVPEEAAEEEEPKPKKPKRAKKERPPKPKRVKKEKGPEPAPKKKRAAPKKEAPEEEAPPASHYTGGKITERTPGVCKFVVDLLLSASRQRPLTRTQIADAVVKRFPGRDPERLRNIARGCKGWMKVHYGMDVSGRRTEEGEGLWLEPAAHAKGLAFIARKRAKGGERESEDTVR
jgi:hypothetical protein